ncbi:MAG TPA: hypothetical protein VJU18_12235 [Vicinamibacteria bacterium]|nr:hypothetical protein [Vicinamibacteria bacterium]
MKITLRARREWAQVALVVAVLASASAPSARAGSCVRLDAARDTLAPEEQKAATLLFEEALTREGRTLDRVGCDEEWVLSHVRLGDSITVVVASPRGRRSDRVRSVEEFPAQYSQSIRALLTGRDPANELAGVVDRANVTSAQVDVKRVSSDSVFFVRLGYGVTSGPGDGGGPLLGFGWRKELNRVALDVAFADLRVLSEPDGSYSSGPFDGGSFTLVALGVNYNFRPLANSTPYAGVGLGYTRWQSGQGKGLDVRLCLGYEMLRASNLRLFIQADGIIPTYDVTRTEWTDWRGWDPGAPGPKTSTFRPATVAISLGIGWSGGRDDDDDD